MVWLVNSLRAPYAAATIPKNAMQKHTPYGVGAHYPVFDPEVLGALFNHEAMVIAGVLQTFASSISASLSELRLAVAAQDLPRVGTLAHKIMGASHQSGAHALGQTARSVELCVQQGDAAGAQSAAEDLDAQWRLLQTCLDALHQKQKCP